jgi:hypothetical protein
MQIVLGHTVTGFNCPNTFLTIFNLQIFISQSQN